MTFKKIAVLAGVSPSTISRIINHSKSNAASKEFMLGSNPVFQSLPTKTIVNTPMLTTIHIPIDELGRMAVKMLIDRIEHGNRIPIKVELPFSFSIRESCQSYKKGDLKQ